jgi:aconitate hydratase
MNSVAAPGVFDLVSAKLPGELVTAGARPHQPGCNGCIGMGQAPAAGRISLRTVPRYFPGRLGTREDTVYLCSPETAAASALTGAITDPRDLGQACPKIQEPERMAVNTMMFVPPADTAEARRTKLEKTPNITTLPELGPFEDNHVAHVLLKAGDNVSTDDIIPAGVRVLPYWSNISKVAEFAFEGIDETYATRAKESRDRGETHIIVAGSKLRSGL